MAHRRALFFLLAIGGFAAAAQMSETVYQTSELRPLNMPPRWSNGFLAVFGANGISVYNGDGSLRYEVRRSPNASVVNVAFDTDGTLAATHHDGPILIVDPTGAVIRRIETPGFSPSSAAFAPDHTIWLTGTRQPASRDDTSDYNLLLHYARTGELLGSFLSRASFPTIDDPIQNVTALPDIHVAAGRASRWFR